MRYLLVLTVVAALLIAIPGPAEAKPGKCPTSSNFEYKDFTYRVTISKGKVTCAKARTTLRTFIRTAKRPKDYTCFRGHGDEPAASCANSKTLFRAILVAG